MTEEFDQELEAADADSMVNSELITESSIVPPESAAEEAFAAAANAIPAVGGPIVVDPYAVLGATAPAPHQPGPSHHVPYSYSVPGQHSHGQPGYYPGQFGVARPSTDGFAIAAIICGIAGLVFAAPVIGSILGVVFGIIALHRIRDTGVGGHALAITGIVTGALGLLLGLIVLAGIIPALLRFNLYGPWWM